MRHSSTWRAASVVVAATTALGLSSVPAGAATTVLRQNAEEQLSSDHVVTLDEALAAARRFDVIVALRGTYRPYVAAMKQANPELTLLVYENASFAQSNQGSTYPSPWYARSRWGAKIRSTGWGNWLMDVTDAGWISDRAATCRRFLADSGYDGCFLDLLGTAPLYPGYLTSPPVNRATGTAWTRVGWLRATSHLASVVRQSVAPAPVFGNGLGSGSQYFDPDAPSRRLLDVTDGGLAEVWLRTASQGIREYRAASAWRQDVDMLLDASARGKPVLVVTKVWTSGTRRQKAAWRRFALASFLLAADGRSSFFFSKSPSADPTVPTGWRPDLGLPLGHYAHSGGVYRRLFTNGQVAVNPTGTRRRLDLGGTYVNRAGDRKRVVDLPAHSGGIYVKP